MSSSRASAAVASVLGALAAALLVSCGKNSFAGEYSGENCGFEKLSLGSDGQAYISMLGMQMPGTYTVDGDRVSLFINGKGIVLTHENNVLTGQIGFLGLVNTLICEKQ